MGKSLVIVESPAKARTINKYLGRDFVVKSSVGHIRDLPVSGSGKQVDAKARARAAAKTRKLAGAKREAHRKEQSRKALFARMGIDPDDGWKANYEILPGKEKVVTELRKFANQADAIYLATDLDREGEAIAWHLREVIGGDPKRFKRVVFNEITQGAIRQAFESPGELDLSRVNAQQARRFLDRVVGYMLSPLLWSKVARGLSAGRVQSVAVRLIVEREKEIRAFVPEEFWEIHADTRTRARAALRLEVARHLGEAFRPVNEAQASAAVRALELADFEVVERKDKPTKTKPGAPYITSTLQQAASTRLGFSVKKTMMLAQRLYEAGHITYMRTDSTNLSREAVEACRATIGRDFGARYVPAEPNVYSSKQGAQEAHEAIRPSHVEVRPGQLQGVERDQERLYELIWRQFVACQMVPAEYLSTNLAVKAGEYELRTRGRIVVFDGHTRVQATSTRGSEEEQALPDVQVGERLDLVKLEPLQHFTKPPPRFGEASLVKELEKRGIGRPSTYASIISTIQDRGYVRLDGRRFHAEKMGEIVTERLVENFGELMDYGFTAGLEEALDEVAVGSKQWKKVLGDFYDEFRKQLTAAEHPAKGMRANAPTGTDIACPQCGRPMQIRTASTGVFLGCSGYALPPKERCKSTINLIPGDEAVAVRDEREDDDDDAGDETEARLLLTKRHCPLCKTAMNSYLVDETRKLHVCGNNPDCPGYEIEAGTFQIKGYEGPVVECDKCGEDMQLKSGRFGKYFGCTSDVCKNTRKLLRNGEAAPPKVDPIPMPHLRCERCDDFYLLRDGAAGIFLAASQFPKHRETRAPTVAELVFVKDQLDPKYRYLADAPKADPEGRPSVVRFARKTREQYVTSEVDGKATSWRAHYRDGRWVEERGAADLGERSFPRRMAARETAAPRKRAAARKAAGSKTGAGKSASAKAAGPGRASTAKTGGAGRAGGARARAPKRSKP